MTILNSGIDSIGPVMGCPGSPPARHGNSSLQRAHVKHGRGEVRDVGAIQEFCMLHGPL